MDEKMDLTPVILWIDEETGEVIYGGTDSPEADARRAELEELRRARWIRTYGYPPPPHRFPKPPSPQPEPASEADSQDRL